MPTGRIVGRIVIEGTRVSRMRCSCWAASSRNQSALLRGSGGSFWTTLWGWCFLAPLANLNSNLLIYDFGSQPILGKLCSARVRLALNDARLKVRGICGVFCCQTKWNLIGGRGTQARIPLVRRSMSDASREARGLESEKPEIWCLPAASRENKAARPPDRDCAAPLLSWISLRWI